jgi:acetyl-CoA carboxylase biotin carboxyl carrier protein
MESYEEETQTLRELLAIMHEHDLDRIKVKLGDAFYELVRREAGSVLLGAPVAGAAAAAPLPGEPQAPPPNPNLKRVTAPLTGVFYRSASPDEAPFVAVGDRVEAGEVLCILEAMKLFNEIQSDFGGTIERIIPQNGELVAQGDELFWIAP